MRGVSNVRCSFTHQSIKQGLSNIFPFYSPQNGWPIHEYKEAHQLLGLDVRDKCMAFCPLIFPNRHIIGNQHFMLCSDHILRVSAYKTFNQGTYLLFSDFVFYAICWCKPHRAGWQGHQNGVGNQSAISHGKDLGAEKCYHWHDFLCCDCCKSLNCYWIASWPLYPIC